MKAAHVCHEGHYDWCGCTTDAQIMAIATDIVECAKAIQKAEESAPPIPAAPEKWVSEHSRGGHVPPAWLHVLTQYETDDVEGGGGGGGGGKRRAINRPNIAFPYVATNWPKRLRTHTVTCMLSLDEPQITKDVLVIEPGEGAFFEALVQSGGCKDPHAAVIVGMKLLLAEWNMHVPMPTRLQLVSECHKTKLQQFWWTPKQGHLINNTAFQETEWRCGGIYLSSPPREDNDVAPDTTRRKSAMSSRTMGGEFDDDDEAEGEAGKRREWEEEEEEEEQHIDNPKRSWNAKRCADDVDGSGEEKYEETPPSRRRRRRPPLSSSTLPNSARVPTIVTDWGTNIYVPSKELHFRYMTWWWHAARDFDECFSPLTVSTGDSTHLLELPNHEAKSPTPMGWYYARELHRYMNGARTAAIMRCIEDGSRSGSTGLSVPVTEKLMDTLTNNVMTDLRTTAPALLVSDRVTLHMQPMNSAAWNAFVEKCRSKGKTIAIEVSIEVTFFLV
jgi:hypothetical protein